MHTHAVHSQSVATMESPTGIRVVGFLPTITQSATTCPHASQCSTPASPSHQQQSPLSVLKGETALPKLRCRTKSVGVDRGVTHDCVALHRRCNSMPIEALPRDVPQQSMPSATSLHGTSTPAIPIPSPSSHGYVSQSLCTHAANILYRVRTMLSCGCCTEECQRPPRAW